MYQRLKGPQESLGSAAKQLVGLLQGVGGTDFLDDISSLADSQKEPADWGKLNETPALLWDLIKPVLRIRDKVAQFVYDHLTVDVIANAIAAISAAVDKLVYMALGVVLGPVLEDISLVLAKQTEGLLIKDQEARLGQGKDNIFDDASTATDPTHSQLCKDHYGHPLNELGGLVAIKITTSTIKKVIELWQPGSQAAVKPVIDTILETLHHPFNYSMESDLQSLMVAQVFNWCSKHSEANPEVHLKMLQGMDKAHQAALNLGEASHHQHAHGSGLTDAYADPTKTAAAAVPATTGTGHVAGGDNISQPAYTDTQFQNSQQGFPNQSMHGDAQFQDTQPNVHGQPMHENMQFQSGQPSMSGQPAYENTQFQNNQPMYDNNQFQNNQPMHGNNQFQNQQPIHEDTQSQYGQPNLGQPMPDNTQFQYTQPGVHAEGASAHQRTTDPYTSPAQPMQQQQQPPQQSGRPMQQADSPKSEPLVMEILTRNITSLLNNKDSDSKNDKKNKSSQDEPEEEPSVLLEKIGKIFKADPSSANPNPIDHALTLLPGLPILSIFDGLDEHDIVAAPSMGIVLKDGVLKLRALQEEKAEKEGMTTTQSGIQNRARTGDWDQDGTGKRSNREWVKLLDIEKSRGVSAVGGAKDRGGSASKGEGEGGEGGDGEASKMDKLMGKLRIKK